MALERPQVCFERLDRHQCHVPVETVGLQFLDAIGLAYNSVPRASQCLLGHSKVEMSLSLLK